MMSVVLFYFTGLLLLSAGGVYGAVRFSRRFEEVLPISIVCMVVVLQVFGLFGLLRIGIVLLFVAAPLFYAAALLRIRREGRAAFQRVATPAALLYAVCFAGLIYLNYGRLPVAIDEMTHWADTVKAIFHTGLMPSEKTADTFFPTYPPGMALLEYLFLRLYAVLDRSRGYTEWVMYVAYQSFLLAFFLPFLRDLDAKKPLRSLLTVGFLLMCPLMMDQSHPYSSLYIDPFICMVFGCGLAAIFSERRKGAWYSAYLCACCVILVLAKTAGLLLAVFLAGIYAAELFCRCRDGGVRRRGIALAAASVALPWSLWKLQLALSGVTASYSGKEGSVQPRLILRLMLHLEGENWRQVIHDEYYRRLFADAVRIKGLYCPYWLLLLLCAVSLVLILRLSSRRDPALEPAARVLLPSLVIVFAVYYISMCYMYLFKFDHYEAVALKSLGRYVGIVLYAVYAAALLCFTRLLMESEQSLACSAAALCLFLLLSPFGRAIRVLDRSTVETSLSRYPELSALVDRMEEQAPGGGAKIYLVSQQDRFGDFYHFHYYLRPNRVSRIMEWYFGPGPGPGMPDREIGLSVWRQTLTEENYDYVYLYHLDDYFVERFGALFAPDSPPEEHALYRVEGQMLYRVC